MAVIRAFIAIDLALEVITSLEKTIGQLKQRIPGSVVRWVPAENIHLTLKFLGDVPIANLDPLKRNLQDETGKHSAFDIQVQGIGAFPSIRKPRVIWSGIEAPAELAALQQAIDLGTASLGYASEERDFSPHLTLGRVSRNITPQEMRLIGDVLNNFTVESLGYSHVQEVHLYKSDLKPSGAIYSRIYSTHLR